MRRAEHLRVRLKVAAPQHCLRVAAAAWHCVVEEFGLGLRLVESRAEKSPNAPRPTAVDFVMLQGAHDTRRTMIVGEILGDDDVAYYPEVGAVSEKVYHVDLGERFGELVPALYNWLYWKGDGLWGRPAGRPRARKREWKTWIDSVEQAANNFGRHDYVLPVFDSPMSVVGCIRSLAELRSGRDSLPDPLARPRVALCYSRTDTKIRDRLAMHIARYEDVDFFFDGKIPLGWNWPSTVAQRLRTADVVVLVVSADFYQSSEITKKELPIVREQHDSGGCEVVPLYATYMPSADRPVKVADGIPWSIHELQSPNGPGRPLRQRGTQELDESLLAECVDSICTAARQRAALRQSRAWSMDG